MQRIIYSIVIRGKKIKGTYEDLRKEYFKNLIRVERDQAGKWLEIGRYVFKYAESDYYVTSEIEGDYSTGYGVEVKGFWINSFEKEIERVFPYREFWLYFYRIKDMQAIKKFITTYIEPQDEETQQYYSKKLNELNPSDIELIFRINLKTNSMYIELKLNHDTELFSDKDYNDDIRKNIHKIYNWLQTPELKIDNIKALSDYEIDFHAAKINRGLYQITE